MKLSIKSPVLVINASYEPLAITTAKRALKLWAKGIARIEETYPHPFYPGMFLPSVIRLNDYRHVPIRKHTVSRRSIFLRDKHTCQYCAKKMAPGSLTLDHVFPRSRGGRTTWENLVACCYPCNSRKGSRTPEEAGMDLLARPKSMNLHTQRHLMRNMGEEEPSWKKYLYF